MIGGGRSPATQYLFAGLAAMMGLVVAAMAILYCSFRRESSRRDEGMDLSSLPPANGAVSVKPIVSPPDLEPKILVVMAGDETPSFLANKLP